MAVMAWSPLHLTVIVAALVATLLNLSYGSSRRHDEFSRPGVAKHGVKRGRRQWPRSSFNNSRSPRGAGTSGDREPLSVGLAISEYGVDHLNPPGVANHDRVHVGVEGLLFAPTKPA